MSTRPPSASGVEIGRLRCEDVAPGTMVRMGVAPRAVLVANVRGLYYALDDACPHNAFSLSAGELDGPWVRCPGHGWRINVRNGGVLQRGRLCELGRTLPVEVRDGWIIVRARRNDTHDVGLGFRIEPS